MRPIAGHRVCAHSGSGSISNISSSINSSSSDRNGMKTPLWWIFQTSGHVWTGLGIPMLNADSDVDDGGVAGEVTVFDCSATVTQRGWNGGSSRRGRRRWSWRFVPWCLPAAFSHPANLRSSFFPTPSLNQESYSHLNTEVPLQQVLESSGTPQLLQRMRGTVSLATADALLNVSRDNSSALSVLVLDCGCCGWVTLLAMADEILTPSTQSASSAFLNVTSFFDGTFVSPTTVVARLPLLRVASSELPSQLLKKNTRWVCDNATRSVANGDEDGGVGHPERGLRRALSRIREAFRIVSWDHLSSKEVHVTLMPRFGTAASTPRSLDEPGAVRTNLDVESVDAAVPTRASACATGDINVCDVEGCRYNDTAHTCISPKMLDYVKTIMNVCMIRRMSSEKLRVQQKLRSAIKSSERPICSGLHHENGRFVMKVADDEALVALISYAARHDVFAIDDHSSKDRGAILVDISVGGIGNVFQPLFAASMMAVMDGRQLLVTMQPRSRERYEGHFTCAVDAFLSVSANDLKAEMIKHDWHVRHEVHIFEERDHFRCGWGVPDDLSYGAITHYVGGLYPVSLIMNEKYSDRIRTVFGVDADFYLSHFVIMPVAEIRQRAYGSMAFIRAQYGVVIGIHMRWIAQGMF